MVEQKKSITLKLKKKDFEMLSLIKLKYSSFYYNRFTWEQFICAIASDVYTELNRRLKGIAERKDANNKN